MQQNHEVTMRIMACFALGLGLPEDFFVEVRVLPLMPLVLLQLSQEGNTSPIRRLTLTAAKACLTTRSHSCRDCSDVARQSYRLQDATELLIADKRCFYYRIWIQSMRTVPR